jgi:hypothetical protein
MVKGRVKNMITEDDIEQALLQRLEHLHGFDVPELNHKDVFNPLPLQNKQGMLYD